MPAMTREDMRERDAELCAMIEQQQEQLRAVLAHVEELRAENEQLKIALGPGATEAWKHLHDEVERLETAIAYVRQRSQRACEILNEFNNTHWL